MNITTNSVACKRINMAAVLNSEIASGNLYCWKSASKWITKLCNYSYLVPTSLMYLKEGRRRKLFPNVVLIRV
jgi:hypothetical protein